MLSNIIINKTLCDIKKSYNLEKKCENIRLLYDKCLKDNNHKVYFCQDLRYKYEECIKTF